MSEDDASPKSKLSVYDVNAKLKQELSVPYLDILAEKIVPNAGRQIAFPVTAYPQNKLTKTVKDADSVYLVGSDGSVKRLAGESEADVESWNYSGIIEGNKVEFTSRGTIAATSADTNIVLAISRDSSGQIFDTRRGKLIAEINVDKGRIGFTSVQYGVLIIAGVDMGIVYFPGS